MRIFVFYFQIVDGTAVCAECSYPMCSAECSTRNIHTQECAVLRGVPSGSEGVNYKVVAVLRLLQLRDSSSPRWEQIGRAGDLIFIPAIMLL